MPLCEPIAVEDNNKNIKWIREIELDDLAIERNGKDFFSLVLQICLTAKLNLHYCVA